MKLMLQLIQQQSSQILFVIILMLVLPLILRPVANKISLLDEPNARKTHQKITPLIGGICIFLSCSLTLFIFGVMGAEGLTALVVASGGTAEAAVGVASAALGRGGFSRLGVPAAHTWATSHPMGDK